MPELAAHYAAQPQVKGEIVVVIGAPIEGATGGPALDEALRVAMAGASVKDASSEVAARLGSDAATLRARLE